MRIRLVFLVAALVLVSGVALTTGGADAASVEPLDVTTVELDSTTVSGITQELSVPQQPSIGYGLQYSAIERAFTWPWNRECNEYGWVFDDPGAPGWRQGHFATIGEYSGLVCWM